MTRFLTLADKLCEMVSYIICKKPEALCLMLVPAFLFLIRTNILSTCGCGVEGHNEPITTWLCTPRQLLAESPIEGEWI